MTILTCISLFYLTSQGRVISMIRAVIGPWDDKNRADNGLAESEKSVPVYGPLAASNRPQGS